jgi:hypothetical protein
MRKMLILENVGLELEVEEHILCLVLISVICFVLWLAFKFVLIGLFTLCFKSLGCPIFDFFAMVSAYTQPIASLALKLLIY